MVVRELDPYVPRSLPVYISSLVDLRRKAELFKLAHTMVRHKEVLRLFVKCQEN